VLRHLVARVSRQPVSKEASCRASTDHNVVIPGHEVAPKCEHAIKGDPLEEGDADGERSNTWLS
jgi:hypothetical protein